MANYNSEQIRTFLDFSKIRSKKIRAQQTKKYGQFLRRFTISRTIISHTMVTLYQSIVDR